MTDRDLLLAHGKRKIPVHGILLIKVVLADQQGVLGHSEGHFRPDLEQFLEDLVSTFNALRDLDMAWRVDAHIFSGNIELDNSFGQETHIERDFTLCALGRQWLGVFFFFLRIAHMLFFIHYIQFNCFFH